MENKLGTMEMRFAELIWANAPIGSGELVKLCEKELSWKKSTTYTMLRRLCQRGLFQNVDSVVSVLLTHRKPQTSWKRSLKALCRAFWPRLRPGKSFPMRKSMPCRS